MSEPSAIDVQPLTPKRFADLAALFDEGGDPKWCWCTYFRVRGRELGEFDALTAIAGAPVRDARAASSAPRARRLSGGPCRRMGQPRAARGLRAPGLLEGARAARRRPGLVDRLLRRLASVSWSGCRGRSARRGDRRTPATTARRPWRPTRSVRRRARRSRRPTPTTARSRCSNAPGSRSSRVANGTPRRRPTDRPARPVGASEAADYVIRRGSNIVVRRVDTPFAAG